MKYRAEIDGLRALAVLPVILFHAGFSQFEGGFVGVDVFFVISGFLISTILIEEIDGSSFSLVGFYERRARRILPALFVVVAVCVPFAWAWMLPSQLKDFAQSVAFLGLFSSNILFWLESGYFDTTAELKPLLHTWSLAVEEQFYLFFPMLLALIWQWGRAAVFTVILILLVVSFSLSEIGWRTMPDGNFYLPVFRFWELLFGALAALYIHRCGVRHGEGLSFVGVAAILFAIFWYGPETPFPSFYTLVPVVGTTLILIYASPETVVARALSMRLLVGVGLISYSAYLWHQPLFAFARLRLLHGTTEATMLALSVCSLGLAWITWKFVENPFRSRSFCRSPSIFIYSCVGLGAMVAFGIYGHVNNGFPDRLDYPEYPYHTMVDADGGCFGRTTNWCNQLDERKKIFVLGDSTIQTLATSLQEMQDEFAVVPVTASGCLLVRGYTLFDSRSQGFQSNCLAEKVERALDAIRDSETVLVVYGGMFTKALTGQRVGPNGEKSAWLKELRSNGSKTDLQTSIHETVNELTSISGRLVLLEFPEFGVDPQQLLLSSNLVGANVTKLSYDLNHIKKNNAVGRSLMNQVAVADNVTVLDPLEHLCKDSKCYPLRDAVPMFTDTIHPSKAYADTVAQHLITTLQGDVF